jgi:prepilin-type processing-associated H-X9-DG protein
MNAAEDAADRNRSATNLRQIGQAITLYANENKGAFPPDVATVVKSQSLTAEIGKSPFGPAKDGIDSALIQYGGATNPMTNPRLTDVIVAYDQAALEQGEGTNALYGDGHVDWLPPEAIKRALDESRKKVAQQPAQQPQTQPQQQ